MGFRPGTVSKILWHFTGGPLWDSEENKQLKELKPTSCGYDALTSILESRQLRVGSYKEVVKVIIPIKRKYNPTLGKVEEIKNYEAMVSSSPVCCVADIPLQHIAYHSNRYGKIAIGFHRDSIVNASFNPVMYTLDNTELVNSIYKGYSSLSELETREAIRENDSLQYEINDLVFEHDLPHTPDASSVENELDYIEKARKITTESYERFLAYIKTFQQDEFDSIYCEREWRSTSSYNFDLSDIAIIILPKNAEGRNFYQDFINSTDLPRNITIGCWEDLIEH
ncbi:abortive infection system antitoxin AbiGi family protein [Vibrio splendidus]